MHRTSYLSNNVVICSQFPPLGAFLGACGENCESSSLARLQFCAYAHLRYTAILTNMRDINNGTHILGGYAQVAGKIVRLLPLYRSVHF